MQLTILKGTDIAADPRLWNEERQRNTQWCPWKVERTLLKALGAGDRQVMGLFLGEATFLAGSGGLLGVLLGLGVGRILTLTFPILRVVPAPWIVPVCLGSALLVGALSGFVPARRAARMSPIRALREE